MENRTLKRFNSKWLLDPRTGCWIWNGSKTIRGYGRFYFNGKNRLAHRVVWAIHEGVDIGTGVLSLHKCDNTSCVNPAHLFLGTQTNNMQDCIHKRRFNRAVGEKHGQTFLTEENVRFIRASKNKKTELARQFKTSHTTIRRIQARKTWRYCY